MTGRNDAYPPALWTIAEVQEALTGSDDTGVVPTYEDLGRWEEIGSDPLTGDVTAKIRTDAEQAADEPTPRLPATRYADLERTGNRSRYERAYFRRHERLSLFALAECFEREGAYLDDVPDEAWATCEQTTWLLPAHLPDDERRDGVPVLEDPYDHHVALFSARTAHTTVLSRDSR